MKDTDTICLAGGCFWGMEALYRRLPGVTDVVCGYANGDTAAHANYETVCTGITGFREAVLITWDTGKTSLEALLFAFFAVVDVELPNRQGADIGTQYQTGIYWTTPEQARVVQAVAAMEAAAVPVFAVELKPLENFSRRRHTTSGTWNEIPGATATFPLPGRGRWHRIPSGGRTTPVPPGSCWQRGWNHKTRRGPLGRAFCCFKKSLEEFRRPQTAGLKFVFGRDMCVDKNTSRSASVAFGRNGQMMRAADCFSRKSGLRR